MASYSTTQTFNAEQGGNNSMLIVRANAGTITVQYQRVNLDWITADVYSSNVVKLLNTSKTNVRIQVSGDAEFDFIR